jgi:hypothetical protein
MAKLSSYLRGNTTITGITTYNNIIINSGESTGTTDQNLQVTGGSYISGNTGIGSAIPQSKLDVLGDSIVSGISTASEFSLSSIDSSITDTAVDVFVYDTRKDSDGGAWRKRTQHTSWYNETLNTATRGSRREFPAVAVIVAETAKVTIYDGDDPDLPMWMVFNSTATRSFLGYTIDPRVTSIKAINAEICIGSSSELNEVNFLRDNSLRIGSTASWYTRNNISQRNVNFSSFSDIGLRTVAGGRYNIAMTVLPNAPIDSTTGLPIPTIAVATDGGVSVIKDDGTVSDLRRGGTSYTNSVQFTDNNSIMLVWGHASDAIRHINHYSYGDWQTDKTDYDQATGYHELPQFGSSALQSPLRSSASGIVSGVLVNLNSQNRMSAKWDDYGLKLADLNDSDRANGMVAHIRPEYNSGWMHGDCKGAFLSDTDATNVTGAELIVNGTFDSNANGWSVPSGSTSTLTYNATDDDIDFVRNNEACGETDAAITLEVGKTYVLTWELKYTSDGNNGYVYLGMTGMTSTPTTSEYRGVGVKTHTFTATDTGGKLFINAGGVGGLQFTLDNISLRLAEEDRSVNDNGLQVFGTVNKTAVATGAELVAYSGWSSSNYLQQPYNSALDFGIGDFYFGGWFKNAGYSDYQHLPPEQIKKMYEDEKFLFQENSQVTLYGSSDAVTALAYDDTTELLHVGTSAGRSEFPRIKENK